MSDLTAMRLVEPWMPAARVLDVTLRDGGFRNAFAWSRDDMCAIASSAAKAGVHTVELGYIGGVPEFHNVNEQGLAAHLSPILVAAAREAGTARLAAMVHPSAATASIDYAAFHHAGLSLVRFVHHPSWFEKLKPHVAAARDAGLLTSINVALASRYTLAEISEQFEAAASIEPDVLYVADTCAGLAPHHVEALVALALRYSPEVGFHAHDFLSLALANGVAAANAGAHYIDASIAGLGRGAGNLRTELWLALQQTCGAGGGDLEPLVGVLDLLERQLGPPPAPDLAAVVAGAANLTPPQEDWLRETGAAKSGSVALAAAQLANAARRISTVEEMFDG